MADKLLAVRGGKPVSKHQAKRFVTRLDKLKIAFNLAKDRQRILQEGLEIISAQFKLVEETKVKYSVYNNDVHNFNKTSFQICAISLIKVVTGVERRARLELVKLGDHEWVTVIQSICAARYVTPPFIIYKGRVYISTWYKKALILRNQKLLVLENGQTNNTLSLEQLKHFNARI